MVAIVVINLVNPGVNLARSSMAGWNGEPHAVLDPSFLGGCHSPSTEPWQQGHQLTTKPLPWLPIVPPALQDSTRLPTPIPTPTKIRTTQ